MWIFPHGCGYEAGDSCYPWLPLITDPKVDWQDAHVAISFPLKSNRPHRGLRNENVSMNPLLSVGALGESDDTILGIFKAGT